MSEKKSTNRYPKEFKEEAAALVTEQGYSVPKAFKSLDIGVSLPYTWKANYPDKLLCLVMKVSKSAYYEWIKRPAKVITAHERLLYRCMKQLFKRSTLVRYKLTA